MLKGRARVNRESMLFFLYDNDKELTFITKNSIPFVLFVDVDGVFHGKNRIGMAETIAFYSNGTAVITTWSSNWLDGNRSICELVSE